ncbi:hypothetical protein HMPREF2785_01020 [Corynebacterium sp. HMSC067D03]|nr:hypothetical protein HMPREF2785_01020 [Corynebacterium sp. HMSC067D03]
MQQIDEMVAELVAEVLAANSPVDVLGSPGLVSQIRIKLMRNYGAEGIKIFANKFDTRRGEFGSDLLVANPPAAYVSNLSYLLPTAFWEAYPYYLGEAGSTFGANDAAVFLSNRSNAERLIGHILRDELPYGSFSPEFLLNIALAATVINVGGDQLLRVIQRATEGRDHRYRLVNLAVTRRLVNAPKPFSESNGGRTAIVVAGQMRNPERALPELQRHLQVNDADYFVSSWSTLGRTSLNRSRLSRVLDSEAIPLGESLTDRELALVDKELSSQRGASLETLNEILLNSIPSLHTDRIHLVDESEPVFKLMDNGMKMHYHNLVWPSILGERYLSRNYDYVVKVRPDLIFKEGTVLTSEDLRSLGPSDIGNDHPNWLFEPWGFGVGDQFFYGRSDVMEALLTTWSPHSVSVRIQTEVFGKPNYLQGHVNLGLELWMMGGNPVSSPLQKNGLFKSELITLPQLRSAIEKVRV